MALCVEIVGGPLDGQLMAIQDGQQSIRLALQLPPQLTNTPDIELSMRTIDLPITLTANGWRAYWNAV